MNSPYMSSEEGCIQEAIAQFYSFFGRMQGLKNDIERLNYLDDVTRNRIMYQLDSIEREYKDSQEWFMTRDVQDVRVGVVGSEFSLKTAVVSLFVEGVLEIEGDEKDGRSKSKITVDGHCKLLLIREETGRPSAQLSQWADVLLLVFSYADVDSLSQVSEFYKSFRKMRQDAPVMLVGIRDDQLPIRRYVKDDAVKETVKSLDRCNHMDVTLSQQSTYLLFAQACRIALSASTPLTFPPNFLAPTCPLPSALPMSMSQNSLASTSSNKHISRTGSGSGSPFPSSPSHIPSSKRGGTKRKSMFGGGKQGSYNPQKVMPTAGSESYGSGRPVPIKEGPINKKSQGLRGEWKKKYLVLTSEEIMYYPSFQDYMTMSHGKSFKLREITVKQASHRGTSSSLSRVATTPPSNHSELTDSLTYAGHQSDRSNSQSPPPGLSGSLDMSYNSTTSGLSSNVRIMGPGHNYGYGSRDLEHSGREFRSPLSPGVDEVGSSDRFEQLVNYARPPSFSRYEGGVVNGGGHARNGSFDDNTMLKQLRSGGMAYNLEESERSATMSRIETKKMKEKKNNSFLSALPASSEEILEVGSQESLGRSDKKRKGSDKERGSVCIDRSHSESAKDKSSYSEKRSGGSKNHKRQRSWAGNKLLDTEGGEPVADTCEFQVHSIDNKIWTFEATAPEEAALWVRAIKYQIQQFFSEATSHKGINTCTDNEIKEIINLEGNEFCADCNSPNPEWGSLNHGCLLCIECSGVHRKLGSHISRIRSLNLDEWSPESRAVMLRIGNKVSRDLWEAKKPKNRPIYSSSREDRERFIKAKYEAKEFLAELPASNSTIAERLMDSVRTDNVHQCLFILAHATPDDMNQLHLPENQAPLHLACQRGLIIITQLLIWNGGDLGLLDGLRHTPQYYAKSGMLEEILSILAANGCVDDFSDASSNVDMNSAPISYQQ